MQSAKDGDEILPRKTRRILLALSTPRTVSQVAKLVGRKRIKLQHYVKKHWVVPLTAENSKGRLYVLSEIGRRLVDVPTWSPPWDSNFQTVSWLLASPNQRLAVIQAVDAKLRMSEEIRRRTARRNPNLTRISTKTILNELVEKGLVDTAIVERLRLYWITDDGLTATERALQFSAGIRHQ